MYPSDPVHLKCFSDISFINTVFVQFLIFSIRDMQMCFQVLYHKIRSAVRDVNHGVISRSGGQRRRQWRAVASSPRGPIAIVLERPRAANAAPLPRGWATRVAARWVGHYRSHARTQPRRTNTTTPRANKHNNQLTILYSVTGQSNRSRRLLQESRQVTRAGCAHRPTPRVGSASLGPLTGLPNDGHFLIRLHTVVITL